MVRRDTHREEITGELGRSPGAWRDGCLFPSQQLIKHRADASQRKANDPRTALGSGGTGLPTARLPPGAGLAGTAEQLLLCSPPKSQEQVSLSTLIARLHSVYRYIDAFRPITPYSVSPLAPPRARCGCRQGAGVSAACCNVGIRGKKEQENGLGVLKRVPTIATQVLLTNAVQPASEPVIKLHPPLIKESFLRVLQAKVLTGSCSLANYRLFCRFW